MKIEFKEEIVPGTKIWYSSFKDGAYISDSGSYNKDEAYEFFQKIVANKGELKTINTLETVEI